MSKTKKLSQDKLAVLYQIPQFAVSKLKSKGIDIYDKEAVRKAVLSQASRPKAWVSGCPWDKKPEKVPTVVAKDADDETDAQIEALRIQALAAADYDDARFSRTKIQSLKEFKQLSVLEGDYIHKDDVVADMTKIGFGVGALLEQLTSDLPAMLEGLTAAQMKVKIREASRRIRLALADETNKLFK